MTTAKLKITFVFVVAVVVVAVRIIVDRGNGKNRVESYK